MTKRIFFANFSSALIATLLCSIILTLVTYEHFVESESSKIISQTQLAVQGVEKSGVEYFSDLSLEYYRLTWIDPNGNVLFDSHSSITDMENHLDREEIQEALKDGFGSSKRKSETILLESFYFAQKLDNGSVLRVSGEQSSLFAFFLEILQPMLLLFILGAWLSGILAYYLSQNIIKPLKGLNLDKPLENTQVYEEIAPLLTQIQRQYQKIEKQIEELSQRQEEFDIITRAMDEGLILLNQNGQILSINDSASHLFHAEKELSKGKNLLTIHRSIEMQHLLDQAFQGVRAEGMITIENQIYQTNVSPIIQGDCVSGVAILLQNATKKNESEQIRREFTANVSHELKTPLHSISGCAELLSHNLVLNEDIPQFSAQIYNEAQRLIRLVDEIISLSRLDEGALELDKEEIDLGSIAKEVEYHLSDMAKSLNLTLSVKAESVKMMGSYTLLSGLLRNLCENAIKYNKSQGSVELIVTETAEIARLQVNDTGIGISDQDKQLIFQRFYRVDKSRSKDIGGTGLGLSIVKHTVAMHQGKLTIESALNVGTSIQIDFPKRTQQG